MNYNNLLNVFVDQVKSKNEKPYLWSKKNNIYVPISWNDTYRYINLLANYLKNTGLCDGARVLLISENRPEWQIADIAILASNCVTVPAYTTITSFDYEYIINHSHC